MDNDENISTFARALEEAWARNKTLDAAQAEADYTVAWLDETYDAALWFGREKVAKTDAANLLCGFKPGKTDESVQDSTDETTRDDYSRMLIVFGDYESRPLCDWLKIASDNSLRVHSWCKRYLDARLKIGMNQPSTVDEHGASDSRQQSASTPHAPSETAEPTAPALAQKPSPKRGVIKVEILSLKWPMPDVAPTLESILDKIPKWVEPACTKIGRPGKGAGGSHLWNPAMLAVCLANMTPQKKWHCNKLALTNFLRNNYSDYFSEWEDCAERL